MLHNFDSFFAKFMPSKVLCSIPELVCLICQKMKACIKIDK